MLEFSSTMMDFGLETLDLDLDFGLWTLDFGLWTLDFGLWILKKWTLENKFLQGPTPGFFFGPGFLELKNLGLGPNFRP